MERQPLAKGKASRDPFSMHTLSVSKGHEPAGQFDGEAKVGTEISKCGHQFRKRSVSSGRSPTIEPRLKISAPEDRYEREAEKAADATIRFGQRGMRGRVPDVTPVEAPSVQRSASNQSPSVKPSIGPKIKDLQREGGEPLPEAVRSQMELGFGRDLGHIRIHRDGQAAEMAKALRARAFTVGSHIVFGGSEYHPGCGDRLIAHELTHSLQQAQGTSIIQRAPLSTTAATVDRSTIVEYPRLKNLIDTFASDFGEFLSSFVDAYRFIVGNSVIALATANRVRGLARRTDAVRQPDVDAATAFRWIDEIIEFLEFLPQFPLEELRSPKFDESGGKGYARIFKSNVDELLPRAKVIRVHPFFESGRRGAKAQKIQEEEQRLAKTFVGRIRRERLASQRVIENLPTAIKESRERLLHWPVEVVTQTYKSGTAFFDGVSEAISNVELSNEQRERLLRNLAFSAPLIPVVQAGMLDGIGREIYDTLAGILTIEEASQALSDLVGLVLAPGGEEIARELGRQAAKQLKGRLESLTEENPWGFAYELGKAVGPVIAGIALAIVSGGAGAFARLAGILKKIPGGRKLIARLEPRKTRTAPKRRLGTIAEESSANISGKVADTRLVADPSLGPGSGPAANVPHYPSPRGTEIKVAASQDLDFPVPFPTKAPPRSLAAVPETSASLRGKGEAEVSPQPGKARGKVRGKGSGAAKSVGEGSKTPNKAIEKADAGVGEIASRVEGTPPPGGPEPSLPRQAPPGGTSGLPGSTGTRHLPREFHMPAGNRTRFPETKVQMGTAEQRAAGQVRVRGERVAKREVGTKAMEVPAGRSGLGEHWAEHGAEFQEYRNARQYFQGAIDFCRDSTTRRFYYRFGGRPTIGYYNLETGTFASTSVNGSTLFTYMRPGRQGVERILRNARMPEATPGAPRSMPPGMQPRHSVPLRMEKQIGDFIKSLRKKRREGR